MPHSIILAVLFASQGAVPSYWGDLTPGPFQVGVTQRWVVDSTRRLPDGGPDLPYRPVLLNLWYPTAEGRGAPFPYHDYFDGAIRAAGASPGLSAYAPRLVAYQRDIAWRELAGAPRDETPPRLRARIEAFLRAPSAAYRDAALPQGTIPVVVYTQGSQSSMDDNVVLCEYLASRGYLVVVQSIPS